MNFKEAEDKFKQLKAQFQAGQIPEEQFKARLEELMLQDEQGRWWMLGYETGLWYYHAGEAWVQAAPPEAPSPHTPGPREPAPQPPVPTVVPPRPPIPAGPEIPATAWKPSYWIAILLQLLFGFGLFYVDRSLKRKWFYAAEAIVAVLAGIITLLLFFLESGSNTSSVSYGLYNSFCCITPLLFLVYLGGFVDVILTCRARRRGIRAGQPAK